ncbi:homocysteine S-methyltransferase family protein [Streptomyces sp. NPDC001941]|uniref:homocysteine S-methyltransferase family protein n=1 Tax=Streptomyces sp. NPDC001941 TaxID=3154659 RepID=UPI00332AC8F5
MARHTNGGPGATGRRMVTDGGMETDLIFHRGVDLPHFAAFPLLDGGRGRQLLTGYYAGYATVARAAGAGLMLEAPTWRAHPDWGPPLGYDDAALARVNRDAIAFLGTLRDRFAVDTGPVVVAGMVGPRGDGYAADATMTVEEAASYHRPQIRAFADAGADMVCAYTLTYAEEAVGIVRAADEAGLQVAVSFTVETDGRLPSGTLLAEAVEIVDEIAAPSHFLVNCAHPRHVRRALETPGDWRARIRGLRYNASAKSHAELDEATELDEGSPGELAGEHARLAALLPRLEVLGGCCGTDARHVAALWGVSGAAGNGAP